MHEYVCWDPEWEQYNDPRHGMTPARTEDEYWESRYEAEAADEADAMMAAISSADLYEFDTEEEREAYILEHFEDRMAELAYEKGC